MTGSPAAQGLRPRDGCAGTGFEPCEPVREDGEEVEAAPVAGAGFGNVSARCCPAAVRAGAGQAGLEFFEGAAEQFAQELLDAALGVHLVEGGESRRGFHVQVDVVAAAGQAALGVAFPMADQFADLHAAWRRTLVSRWRPRHSGRSTSLWGACHGGNRRTPARRRSPARRIAGQHHPRPAGRGLPGQDRAHPQGRQGGPQGLAAGRATAQRGARRAHGRRTAAGGPCLQPVPQPGQHRRAVPPYPPAWAAGTRTLREPRAARAVAAPGRRRPFAGAAGAAGGAAGHRAGADRASDRGGAAHADPEIRRHGRAAGGPGSRRPQRGRAGAGACRAGAADRRGLVHRRDPPQPADAGGRSQVGLRGDRAFPLAGAAGIPPPDRPRAVRRHRPAPAALRRTGALRLVDGRRSRRQPQRHRGGEPRGAAAGALDGRRPLPARSARAPAGDPGLGPGGVAGRGGARPRGAAGQPATARTPGALLPLVARLWHGRDRRRCLARLPAPGGVLRALPGPSRRAPGLRAPPCGPGGDHRLPRPGRLCGLGRRRAPGLPPARAGQPPAAAAAALPAVRRHRRSARHLPRGGRGAGGVPGLLRHLHGRCAVRCAGRATAAEGGRAATADPRGAAVRDPRGPRQRRTGHRAAARAARLPLTPAWPAGGDDRLLRLGQGRRHHGRRLGPVPRAGGIGGNLPPAPGRAAALPWPWRHRRTRRRPGPRGDPVATAGLGGGAFPHHRAGRDDPLQVRPAGHRRAEPQPLPGRRAGGDPAAAAATRARVARGDGPPGRRRRGRLPRGGARASAIRRVLPPGHARAGVGAPAPGQPPGQAPRRWRGEPAGDPLDLRLDPDPADAAGLAGLGACVAQRGGAGRDGAAAGDARALAVLRHPHRHAGNGPGQGRCHHRRTL
ncbi:hypothetical protein Lal_00015089 [Lupinus albus]|nr:hypothetical protein Lal_00015089 [Lupinus albus]